MWQNAARVIEKTITLQKCAKNVHVSKNRASEIRLCCRLWTTSTNIDVISTKIICKSMLPLSLSLGLPLGLNWCTLQPREVASPWAIPHHYFSWHKCHSPDRTFLSNLQVALTKLLLVHKLLPTTSYTVPLSSHVGVSKTDGAPE